MDFIFPGMLPVMVVLVFLAASSIKILSEWERGVVLRLGRSVGIRGPGLILLIPVIEKLIKVDIRTVTMEVKPQDVITKDNVSMQVNAVVYFKVVTPEDAITKVEDYYFATGQVSQTTLRSVMGQFSLDDLLAHRDKINLTLQGLLDKHTESWGIKIIMVEVKQIDLPKEMQRAMAREAESERERRAKIISADGEVQRAQKLADASSIIANSPAALQLAYLQSLNEVASEKSTVIIFPVPVDLLTPLYEAQKNRHKQPQA